MLLPWPLLCTTLASRGRLVSPYQRRGATAAAPKPFKVAFACFGRNKTNIIGAVEAIFLLTHLPVPGVAWRAIQDYRTHRTVSLPEGGRRRADRTSSALRDVNKSGSNRRARTAPRCVQLRNVNGSARPGHTGRTGSRRSRRWSKCVRCLSGGR